jgi:flagellar FliL protein
MDAGEEVSGGLVIAGRDRAVLFELAIEVLDEVARFVHFFVVEALKLSSTLGPGGAAEAAEVPAPKGKLKLMIAAAAVLLMVVVVAATWFLFFRHPGDEMHADAAPAKPPVFLEVPDMLVNLSGSPGERVQYLKVKIVLEVKEERQVEAIKPTMPRVTDIFQTYLRELRVSDLNGSAGLFRLKEELTRRVNTVISPSQVNAVLFKEIVIQ